MNQIPKDEASENCGDADTPRKPAVVLIGHGSRRGGANRGFERYVTQFQDSHSDRYQISHGYVELAEPFMGDALRAAAADPDTDEIVAVPLLLFRAGHAKNDLPIALAELRKEFPDKTFHAADALGVHPDLGTLMQERVTQAVPELAGEAGENERARTAVVVIGRGSSDPDANGDFYKQCRVFGDGRGYAQVLPCFAGITAPELSETLDLAARGRPKRIVVMPYMLQAGILVERIRDQVENFRKDVAWVETAIAEPLGTHPAILKVLEQRVAQAMGGAAPLACDNCKFRVEMPDQGEHVGGLRALLWSVRHTFTHNQAMPHEHAHKPLQKHVLVCGNVNCAGSGGVATLEALRQELKRRGLSQQILVTRTSCLGHCGSGPNLIVYPDGIWYRGVGVDDVAELVEEHLAGDRLVARLVDTIM